ncbi:LOW QUALITY PROTEIN: E3 ubiquitin/ISG15 ligase TRIM25-like [Alosa alosa]|uniref:LOW QUALITY PROTEIN: E3 ubiquitin/ISG15 ligase TRIM25-like n=1 Tax=Alosa alosa TaxID=278164 RepID=UPI0020154382|nr:LOW QUALITY PROTEIN: E3 ubiquitin/ISG15 ligase TRIM25-like [Alosa alosa]
MAEANNQELFTCPICLDLLNDPVTIPCGHSYCMDCIKNCWDKEAGRNGIYSCPQCRETFSQRPVVKKNNIVAELVEQMRKTRIQTSSVAQAFAAPVDVECDVCTGEKRKAVKSCLECLASYCETHFETHNELHAGRHSVIDATAKLQERMCSHHKKVLEIFCRTDQSCICYLCMMDEHKGHDTVTAAAEWSTKQNQRKQTQTKFQQTIQEKEKELQELRSAVETLTSSAQTAVEDSERIFTEMIHTIERRRSEVKELIRAQEKAEVYRAEEHLDQLEQEIAELKRRDAELEQLSHIEDHIHFLLTFQSVSGPPQSQNLTSFTVNQSLCFEAVMKSVSTLKDQLEDYCRQDILKSSTAVVEPVLTAPVTKNDSLQMAEPVLTAPVARDNFLQLTQPVLPAPMNINNFLQFLTGPVTRDDFLQYSSHFTLDRNTAHTNLHLSKRSRRVECRAEAKSYPDHPDRFKKWYQVLCREGVSGRAYWEFERSGSCDIGVAYENISREGSESRFGFNDQSWCLIINDCKSCSSVWFNNKQTQIPLVRSSRIGVYVDHRAGTLAFYSISNKMTLLHEFQTTFYDPLYPGFIVSKGSSVKLL